MRFVAALVVLLAADVWIAITVLTAAFASECTGDCDAAVYWPSVGLLALLLIGACWVTWRTYKRAQSGAGPR